jgi:putative ABC transport system substrate-binding protein
MVSDEAEHLATGAAIVELAATGRIPKMYAYGEYVRLGGLMAYSIDLPETFRRLATLIERFLKAAVPEISPSTDRLNSS